MKTESENRKEAGLKPEQIAALRDISTIRDKQNEHNHNRLADFNRQQATLDRNTDAALYGAVLISETGEMRPIIAENTHDLFLAMLGIEEPEQDNAKDQESNLEKPQEQSSDLER